MLAALLQRCDHLVEDVVPNEEGQFTQTAIAQLQKDLAPARTLVAQQAAVTQEVYASYVKAYEKFLAAPKTTALDALSSDHYYVIRSANPRTPGFVASMKNGVVEAEEVASAAVTQDMPSVLWKAVRQDDGSFVLINKTEQQYAVVHKSSYGESVVANKAPFMWQLKYRKQGDVTGFWIMAGTSNYGWYMPEKSTSHITLRTPNQWNNFWKLERTPIPTGLERLPVFESASGVTYDLSGRVVSTPQHGVVIDAAGHKQVR